MGTYTELSINGYPILETKSSVIPEVMTLFQESDKHVSTRKVSERNELIWAKASPDEDQDEVAVIYSCDVGKVIERLDIMGFTMHRALKEFEDGRVSEVEKYKSWLGDDNDDDSWLRNELNYFINLTFDRYAEALRIVLTQPILPLQLGDRDPDTDPVVKRIIGDNEDYTFGFFASDIRSFIRVACELVPKSSLLVQDITEVVHAGYYKDNEQVRNNSTRLLTAGYLENLPRIILTEGSTDVEILREALALLYPHLFDYYTFLDFASARPQGGAGSLATTVKAFAAAGISNRIIAIFDNDTAAYEARRSLDSLQLPQNIAVCNYPNLRSLEEYPTLGSSGLAPQNINGLAASIERYLGKDILDNGNSFPVKLTGFSNPLGRHQGEVMGKNHIQELFREKVARCKASTDEINRSDWSGLNAIFEVIFHAFDRPMPTP